MLVILKLVAFPGELVALADGLVAITTKLVASRGELVAVNKIWLPFAIYPLLRSRFSCKKKAQGDL